MMSCHLNNEITVAERQGLNVGDIKIRFSRREIEYEVYSLIDDLYMLLFSPNHRICYQTHLKLAKFVHLVSCDSHDRGKCCKSCVDQADFLMDKIPYLREVLLADVIATYNRDPATTSFEEIVIAYPGIYAAAVYRVAHELYKKGVRLLPRLMTECAHMKTGIDIHPGVQAGKGLFIDHGTGVVIGETCIIGENVTIYQGVTLGALRVTQNKTNKIKRHPTLGNNVTIYAGATILGGETVIGESSLIGGNVWVTKSVKPFSKVIYNPAADVNFKE
ncbi:serine O-acetyltransferase [Alkalihalobacillus xiaoxiensis]|uniref:Serine O-acetyltransferase n=1 Tax=Shouchella xiaoxiensis TaxID=766895 RepID=A0ABS2T0P8_9BACI|nr:serine O-acetyltransferase EpsC [Shouchella xiaoxiensis]MBM7841334.1 serine O-acetyltransferase [Shouchella xiaoxiensis]